MGIPTPDRLGTLHSIYIDFGPKVRFYGHPGPLPKPKVQRVVAGSERWSLGGWCIGENAPQFLFIQFCRSSYTNRITRRKVRVNRQNSVLVEISESKSTKFHYISLNVTKRILRS